MAEDITHNTKAWDLYQKQAEKHNENNLEGVIELPDLDKNGKVGEKD